MDRVTGPQRETLNNFGNRFVYYEYMYEYTQQFNLKEAQRKEKKRLARRRVGACGVSNCKIAKITDVGCEAQ